MKDSNIATIFVASGFPSNRSTFFKKVRPNRAEDTDDEGNEDEEDINTTETVAIEGREGLYRQAISIHEKYAARPEALSPMCLAEFAITYQSTKTLGKLEPIGSLGPWCFWVDWGD